MCKIIASFTHWDGGRALLVQGKTRGSKESFEERDLYMNLYIKKGYKLSKCAVSNCNWDIVFTI